MHLTFATHSKKHLQCALTQTLTRASITYQPAQRVGFDDKPSLLILVRQHGEGTGGEGTVSEVATQVKANCYMAVLQLGCTCICDANNDSSLGNTQVRGMKSYTEGSSLRMLAANTRPKLTSWCESEHVQNWWKARVPTAREGSVADKKCISWIAFVSQGNDSLSVSKRHVGMELSS